MTTPNDQGTIRISLAGSQKDIDRLIQSIQSGELKEIAGYSVKSIEIPGMPTIHSAELTEVDCGDGLTAWIEGDRKSEN